MKRTQAWPAFAGLAAAAAIQAVSASTVAYFSFEEGTNGLEVNSVGSSGATGSLTVDGGGNGTNGMVAWSTAASPNYTTASKPTTMYSNNVAMEFDGGDDIYQPNPAGSALATTTFTNFTLEMFVNVTDNSGWNTFVGRDDNGNPGSGTGGQSLLYMGESGGVLGSAPTNSFRVELITASNTNIQVNSSFIPDLNTWYHLAAVGDSTADTLTLYVDGTSVGQVSGFDGLLVPSTPTSWTIGRGQFNGNPGDFFNGYLDEIRWSDEALSTSQFLNAIPEPSSAMLAGLAALGLVARRRRSA